MTNEASTGARARAMLQGAVSAKDSKAMLEAGAAVLQADIGIEAIAPVTGQLGRDPGNAQLWLLLGLLERQAENMPAAVQALGKAIELGPDDPVVVSTHAFVMFEAGLPATELFERALGLAPSHMLVLGSAGARVAEGDRSGAIETLNRHLRVHPMWLPGHARICTLRWQFGDEAFARSFEDALEQVPRNPDLWREYGTLLLNARRYGDALGIVARGRKAVGNHPSLDATEAIARSNLGEVEAADALFVKLRSVQDIAVTAHFVRHLLRSGRAKKAVEAAQAWLPHDRDNRLWPYLSLGWRMLGDERWEWLEGDPKFIGVYDLRDSLPPLDKLAATLRALHTTDREPLTLSLRGGTQTDGHLFQRIDPQIQKLRAAVAATVERHIEQLPGELPGHPLLDVPRRPIRFAGAWSVRLTDGGHHANHTHPQGWLSSALYISLPDELQRSGSDSGWLALGEAPELGVDLDPILMVEPKPGRLVLFPSTMWHGTRKFGCGERLTVAFDTKRPSG